MTEYGAWGDDLAIKLSENDDMGLESFDATDLTQGPGQPDQAPWFKPVNISIKDGVYYVNIYVCQLTNQSVLAQSFTTWLASLKDSDRIRLTVSSIYANIPFSSIVTLMGAFANTPAKFEILLDQIVIDGLAYFYLLADKVIKMEGGALFIPSYLGGRKEDTSLTWNAVHDFYDWLIAEAVDLGRLTQEEADLLNDGKFVVIPDDRSFSQ